GVSERLLARADARVVLPLDGFVQSYNVSVAAALALYHARQDRLARQGRHGDLTEAERDVLTAHYYLRSVQAAPPLLARARGAGRLARAQACTLDSLRSALRLPPAHPPPPRPAPRPPPRPRRVRAAAGRALQPGPAARTGGPLRGGRRPLHP